MKKKKTAAKKTATKKPVAKKKVSKKKTAPIAASADQDIVGLLTMLVQKLTSFESKIDMVLGRLTVVSAPKPQAPVTAVPMPPVVQNKPPKPPRQMYDAVCADCGQDCSVPFKPRQDMPVYCKGCFTKRKSKPLVKPQIVQPKPEPKPEVKPKKTKAVKAVKKVSKAKPKKAQKK